MRIIAVEEAVSVPGAIRREDAIREGFAVPGPMSQEWFRRLADITDLRLADMDANGVDMPAGLRRSVRRVPRRDTELGHMGELLPFQMARLDSRFDQVEPDRRPQHLPSHYLQTNVYVTTSGVMSHAALLGAVHAIGIDRVLFSIVDRRGGAVPTHRAISARRPGTHRARQC